MGDLLKILKECRAKGDMQPFIEAFQKRNVKTKSNVPESLRKIWEKEDSESKLRDE